MMIVQAEEEESGRQPEPAVNVVENDAEEHVLLVSCWLPISLSVIFILLFTGCALIIQREKQISQRYLDLNVSLIHDDYALPSPFLDEFNNHQLQEVLGEKFAKLFAQLDRDGNGLLSLVEYEPLVHLIRPNPVLALDQMWQENQKLLNFQPTPNHRKDFVKLKYTFTAVDPIHPLLKQPQLLPNGRSYDVYQPMTLLAETFIPRESNPFPGMLFRLTDPFDRYPPIIIERTRLLPGPYFHEKEQGLYALFKPFHPSLHILSRKPSFHPMAIVIGVNFDKLFVAFQLCPEILLHVNDTSYWLTSSGLIGTAVVDKSGNELFDLRVQLSSQYADINWMNKMTTMSDDVLLSEFSIRMTESNLDPTLQWDEQMSLEKGMKTLREHTFRILKIDFLNFSSWQNALSQKEQKFVLIVSKGNFMSYSCHADCFLFRDVITFSHENPENANTLQNWAYVWLNVADINKVLQMKQTNNTQTSDTPTAMPLTPIMESILTTISDHLTNQTSKTDQIMVSKVIPKVKENPETVAYSLTPFGNVSQTLHRVLQEHSKDEKPRSHSAEMLPKENIEFLVQMSKLYIDFLNKVE